MYEIVRSKPPHAIPDRPDKNNTTSHGSNLLMLPCIVLIKHLRNRPVQTSTCYPAPFGQNLYEIVRSTPPHATPTRPSKTLTKIVWSEPPHATLHRPDTTFTKSSGASLHMPPRIVKIQPLRNRPEQSSTCYTGSSR